MRQTGTVITISVIYSDRRTRSTSLRVLEKNHIEARLPTQVTIEQISQLVSDNIRFLTKAKRAVEGHKLPQYLRTGTDLYIFGRKYIVEITPQKRTRLVLDHLNQVVLICSKTETMQRKKVYHLLGKKLLEYVEPRVDYMVSLMNVPSYGLVRAKLVRSLWGSCSSNGNLTFNKRLIHYPKEVIDYVITHEVAHLQYKDHSARFWNLVAEYDPNYQENRYMLKVNRYG